MIYKHKEYEEGIVVRSCDRNFIKRFYTLIIESQDCLKHQINSNLFNNPYRPYRRGKNRCKRCGVKLAL